MGKYTPAEAKAIEDRIKIFLTDARVGSAAGGVETMLQHHKGKLDLLLRHRNRGAGLKDYQLDSMRDVSQVYDLVRGLNETYTRDFTGRVGSYLESAHKVLDAVETKDRSFINRRGIARARKQRIIETDEYFWNDHIDNTKKLVEGVCRVRLGEPEDKVWRSPNDNDDFLDKLRAGELSAGELTELIDEGLYLHERTYANIGVQA